MRPQQLINFLTFSIQNKLPVLITGSPGVGKTDIVKAVCSTLGYDQLIMHPVVSEPTDFKGLPFATQGQAEFLPYGNLRKMLEAEKPLLVFLDDLGQSDTSVQKALMQLLLERFIDGKKISDHVVFVGATNRQQDKAGVSSILEPVKSRFASIVELEIHLEDWVSWAIENKMPFDLIQFIRFRPQTISEFHPTREIKNSSCPRTIARVGTMMNMGLAKEMEREVFAGAAGDPFAVEFSAFLKVARELPDPHYILKNPHKSIVPNSLDAQYAVTGALARIVTNETLGNMIEYFGRMPKEFSVKGVQEAITLRGKEFISHPAFSSWIKDHRELLFAA